MPVGILVLLLILLTGCVHHIHVSPLPTGPASTTIPRSLQIAVGSLALEGADHRSGIALLEWPHQDLSQAIVRYVRRRELFGSVFTNPADLTLHIATKLSLTDRQGRYHYHIRMQVEMHEGDRLIKTYLAEHTAAGSVARWVTASDRDPIESALQLALDDVCSRIEADRPLYTDRIDIPVR
ncbi:MAG: hypothetical protein HP491_06545 [Nitrospira sp.]|nr:hypothetical protein [Nitrospira sp.]MBH0180703.1 hypothetical protein [Nitrospira sp.]